MEVRLSERIGKRLKNLSSQIDFLGASFAIIMCYFAMVNIYQFEYKTNNYQIYKSHYLVSGSTEDIDLAQCQYIPYLDQDDQTVINIKDQQNIFLGFNIRYTLLSQSIAFFIVILDFMALIISSIDIKWGLRAYFLACFFDMIYPLQSPLVTNINYGQKCIEGSPILYFFKVNFLLSTKLNLWLILFVGIAMLPLLFCKIQDRVDSDRIKYGCIFLKCVAIVFVIYSLLYYVTSLWTNSWVCNVVWVINTVCDIMGYCIMVQSEKQHNNTYQVSINQHQNTSENIRTCDENSLSQR